MDIFTVANGDRHDVPDIAIVVTDGQSKAPGCGTETQCRAETVAAAAQAKARDIKVIGR